ncbi:MAG: hypothetical protein NTZ11_18310 [Gammaproteobacteria bacterium]|nr:hypothetical protein [Gammaproteobacteria bacterium]
MGITKVVEVVNARGQLLRAVLVQSQRSAATLDNPHAGFSGLGRWQLESGEVLNHHEVERTFTVVSTGEVLRYR